ncbi:MAG TPA: hypothetical protein VIN09_11015 [Chloroflexota bacterium]
MLMDRGYTNVSALKGGLQEWQRRGYPLEGEHPEVPLAVEH